MPILGIIASSLRRITAGVNWTQRTLPVSAGWISVTFGGSTFVAVAQSSTIAATSADGITWTQRTLPASTNWQSVTFGASTFVAVPQYSAIAATSVGAPLPIAFSIDAPSTTNF